MTLTTERPTLRPLRRLATAAGVLAALILPQVQVGAAQAASTMISGVRLNGYEAALLTSINATRTSHGLRALIVVPGATDVARRWSWHLASAQALSHNPSLISDIQGAGSAAWTMMSENVGEAAASSPAALFTAYMNSVPHRANILDPTARYVGIGTVERGSLAWNTIDFTNAYSTRYGGTRVPAAGMSIDAVRITSSRSIAGFESASDPRAATAGTGGVQVSGVRYSGPTPADDRAIVTFTRRASTGRADLYVRDAWQLGSARTLTVRAAASRPVTVQVVVSRAYGATVSLGYMSVGTGVGSQTFALPSAARGFMDTVYLRVQATSLGSIGSSTALSVYDIGVGV